MTYAGNSSTKMLCTIDFRKLFAYQFLQFSNDNLDNHFCHIHTLTATVLFTSKCAALIEVLSYILFGCRIQTNPKNLLTASMNWIISQVDLCPMSESSQNQCGNGQRLFTIILFVECKNDFIYSCQKCTRNIRLIVLDLRFVNIVVRTITVHYCVVSATSASDDVRIRFFLFVYIIEKQTLTIILHRLSHCYVCCAPDK